MTSANGSLKEKKKKGVKFYASLAIIVVLFFGLLYFGVLAILAPTRIAVFSKAGLPDVVVRIWGGYSVVSVLLLAHPRTFAIGCVMFLLNNLFTIGSYLKAGGIGGAVGEAVAMGVIVWLFWAGHPWAPRGHTE